MSDDSQVEGLSLDAQRHEIERYCERHGFTLVRFYADEGVSAHSDQISRRPQLGVLLTDAREGEFDLVVVHTLDRWARNVGVQRQALQHLGDADVGFASVSENVDFTTPSGRLMLTMLGGVSEFFSDQLGVHVSKTKRERAELGLSAGPIPFGYTVPPDPRTAPSIEPSEGLVVRESFERRARGESFGSIADRLNGQGIKPSRTGRGQVWTAHRVRDMLACDFYRGVVTYKGEEFGGRHERLIDDDLFARVQARKGARTQRRQTFGAHGLLQGCIRCNACGQTLQSDRTQYGAAMYRERHSKNCATNGKSAIAADFDAQVDIILASLELPDDWLDRVAVSISAQGDEPDREALKKRLHRLARIYAYGDMTDDEYEASRADIESQLRRASSAIRPSHDEVAALFADLASLWTAATTDEKRRIVHLLFERVYVDLGSKQVTAIVPSAEFGLLLQHALETAERADILLVPPEHVDALDALHAYVTGKQMEAWSSDHPSGDGSSIEEPPPAELLEMVETGENRTPRPERT